MIYEYLLGQIHSPDSFFWVGFISCVNLKKRKKDLWPLFMDGVQLPQGYRATTRKHFPFNHYGFIHLNFPKKLLPTIFEFTRIDSKFWKIYLSWLCVEHVSKRGLVCTSINFNLHAWYEVEIRFSDNLGQKETIDDITWPRRKKSVIYRLDIIFSITHVAQLMVSQRNFFGQSDTCRYPQRDIRRGIPNVIPCQEIEKWQ